MTTISELMQWIDGANIEAPDAAVLSHVGEEPAQLLREELARIRGKFGEVKG